MTGWFFCLLNFRGFNDLNTLYIHERILMEPLYKKSFFIVTFLLVICSHAFAGQIAITIDDSPGLDSACYNRNERTKIIAEKLSESKVQAMFFAIGKNIDNNSMDCLKKYANNGHLIANHSYSHMDLNSVENKEYSDDILKNQELIKNLSTFSKFFRYPLLHEGNTLQKRDYIRDFLKKQNLRNGYVTVDNWDFFINKLLNDAKEKGKKINLENLKRLYIDHIWSAIMFYDKIAVEYLGHSPKHTLLLHDIDTTALFIEDLVKHIRKKGWEIITPTEAYQDPIANYTSETLINNQGKIMAIAIDEGYEGPYSSGEDAKSIYLMFEKYKVLE